MEKIELTSCVSLDFDLDFLPHFIDHYSKLVDNFAFIFHSNNDFDEDNLAKELNQYGINFRLQKWVGLFNAIDKVDLLNELSKTSKYDLILTTDIDEFQVWDGVELNLTNRDAIWGKLRDRESIDKKLNRITTENIFKQFPLITDKTTWHLQLYKPCLFKAGRELSTPHNLADSPIVTEDVIPIDHFRWVDGRYEKSVERYKNYTYLNSTGKRWTKKQKVYTRLPTTDLEQRIREYGDESIIKKNLI